jgi:transcriptional regulator with XRE-family HTH domain
MNMRVPGIDRRKPSKSLKNKTASLGARVRELRTARRWSQIELARQLGVSQPRLSQIENGRGSLTAETFLRLLQLFNVGVDQFGVTLEAASPIQNALARHGATHLVETETLIPTALDEPIEVLWEVLRSPGSARHVTALAPVLVANVDRIALRELATRLNRIGRDARLGWLLESLRRAIAEAGTAQRPADQRDARRADLAASLLLDSGILTPPPTNAPADLLDPDIRTAKTAERVLAEASPEATRWRIATRIRTSDFSNALEEARATR